MAECNKELRLENSSNPRLGNGRAYFQRVRTAPERDCLLYVRASAQLGTQLVQLRPGRRD
jgi:hypothetical protein